MPNASHTEPIRCIPALERTHQPAAAPLLGSRNELAREPIEVIQLEGELAERIASERIKARREENQIGLKTMGGRIHPPE